MHIRRVPAAIAATVIACGALAATALAIASGGGAQVQMLNQSSTNAGTSNTAGWTLVPANGIAVTVPAGASRLVNARFAAESECSGPSTGYCAIRIIVRASSGVITELEPASDWDSHFDTDVAGAAIGEQESHAIERSLRLPAGDYVVYAQQAVTNNAVTLRLDDWHMAVEISA